MLKHCLFPSFADTSPVSTNVTTQVQTNVTTVVCNITNTRTTSSTVTAVPSQIATTATGSNPTITPSGSTVYVPVPVSSSSSNTYVPGTAIPVQNSSVVAVTAHDAANAPTAGLACSRLSVVGDERKGERKKQVRTKARSGVRACKNFFNDPLLV